MRSVGLFVTGTDTGVGKTLVASALLLMAKQRGLRTAAVKPVAAGCVLKEGKWVNDDALDLQRAATSQQTYDDVNPIALELPIAPHIAADKAHRVLSARAIAAHCNAVLERDGVDMVIIEGAGGWFVPLNANETLADVATKLALPVVLVVGMQLGCLNHAILTATAIQAAGLRLAAWVGNCIDPEMAVFEENVATLAARLAAPCLGVISHLAEPRPDIAMRQLDDRALLA